MSLDEPRGDARLGDREHARAQFLDASATGGGGAVQSRDLAPLFTNAETSSGDAAILVPLEVERFCAANKLLEHLKSAVALARKHFSSDCQIRLYVDADPEDGDEYVVLEVASARDPAIDSDAHIRYLEEWSSATQWPASRMILLDLRSINQVGTH
jgi:hypothetical protein